MKVIFCLTNMKATCAQEKNGIDQHEAYLWLKKSLEPSPLMRVSGMRIWNAYKAKYGTKKLTRRRLYFVVRKVLEEQTFQNHKASFERANGGMLLTNTQVNSHLEDI